MADIGAYEAKTRFSALLDRVAQGEIVTVTRRGRPIARLVPIDAETPFEPSVWRSAAADFRRRAQVKASRAEVRSWIEAGRR